MEVPYIGTFAASIPGFEPFPCSELDLDDVNLPNFDLSAAQNHCPKQSDSPIPPIEGRIGSLGEGLWKYHIWDFCGKLSWV